MRTKECSTAVFWSSYQIIANVVVYLVGTPTAQRRVARLAAGFSACGGFDPCCSIRNAWRFSFLLLSFAAGCAVEQKLNCCAVLLSADYRLSD